MQVEEIPKKMKVKKPAREPDMLSKRGHPYWFGPDWCREINGTIGRVLPFKRGPDVILGMVSKDGNVSQIQGSIQYEFLVWHEDRKLDLILLGGDEDSLIDCKWEYTDA